MRVLYVFTSRRAPERDVNLQNTYKSLVRPTSVSYNEVGD